MIKKLIGQIANGNIKDIATIVGCTAAECGESLKVICKLPLSIFVNFPLIPINITIHNIYTNSDKLWTRW